MLAPLGCYSRRREQRANPVKCVLIVLDEFVRLFLQLGEIVGAGEVHVVGCDRQLRVEAEVVLVPEDLFQLVVGGGADPLKGDVKDRSRPLELSPVFDVVVCEGSVLCARAERDHENSLGLHLAGPG